jgi:hypothetical protein
MSEWQPVERIFFSGTEMINIPRAISKSNLSHSKKHHMFVDFASQQFKVDCFDEKGEKSTVFVPMHRIGQWVAKVPEPVVVKHPGTGEIPGMKATTDIVGELPDPPKKEIIPHKVLEAAADGVALKVLKPKRGGFPSKAKK